METKCLSRIKFNSPGQFDSQISKKSYLKFFRNLQKYEILQFKIILSIYENSVVPCVKQNTLGCLS